MFSCFACGGGSTMGYKLAGCRVLGCVEIDPQMMGIYRANHHPAHSFQEPVQDFKSRKDLPDDLFRLDILDGSPPCSTFSMSGDREKAWGKKKKFREGQAEQVLDDLFFHFIDVAALLRPKVVVSENVKGMLLGNASGYVRRVFDEFRRAGYKTQLFLLNSAAMGVPQRRERIFFVSTRDDLKLPMLLLAFGERPIGVRDAIAGAGGERKPLSRAFKTWWMKTPPGKAFSFAHPKGSFFNSYRMHPDLPSNTVTSTVASTLAHWDEPAELSDAELVRLQSFPDDYDFQGAKAKYVLGMSVPPLMMQRLAIEIRRQLLRK